MGEVSSEICSYICLQEVSALDALIDVTHTDSEAGSLKEFQASNHSSDLHDYLIFGSKNLESHLAQVILLGRDWVDHISLSFSFGRGIGVKFMPKNAKIYHHFLSVHFPHSANSQEDFDHAVHLLTTCLRSKVQRGEHVVLAGDWNCQPGEPRFDQLRLALCALGFQPFLPCTPTWFGRSSNKRFDYFWLNGVLTSQLMHTEDSACGGDVDVYDSARLTLGSDHALVSVTFAHKHSAHARSKTRCPRNRCARWTVDDRVLRDRLYSSTGISGMRIKKNFLASKKNFF